MLYMLTRAVQRTLSSLSSKSVMNSFLISTADMEYFDVNEIAWMRTSALGCLAQARKWARSLPCNLTCRPCASPAAQRICKRSEEHTSELQSREKLVCRLLLEKKKKSYKKPIITKENKKKERKRMREKRR